MGQVLGVLQRAGIEEKHMRTLSLNYEEEYEYRNGRSIRKGQRARQTILVTVQDLVAKPGRLDSILDAVVTLPRVEVQNISFDIAQKRDLYVRSRELAYEKARGKAEQYATLSGRKLGRVVSISESESRDVMYGARAKQQNTLLAEAYIEMDSSGRSVPTGEQGGDLGNSCNFFVGVGMR